MSTDLPSKLSESSAQLQKALEAYDTTAQAAAAKATANLSEQGAQVWTADIVKFLSVSILLFTICALVLTSVLLWRSRSSGFHVLRVFGIITIIGISALLLIVGYSNTQLTPIVGLFGAIAGYLLGKDRESSPSDER